MKKIVYWLILFLLILLAGLINFSALDIPGGYKFLLVQSGSMEPVIKRGSLVVVRKADNYQKKEVITYRNEKNSRITTTHRIVDIKNNEFITKGDANDTVDSNLVAKDLILGKVSLAVPFLGYPISFAKTLPGLIILIVIPATIIIYGEILNIKNELSQKPNF